jgi:hypothetical protein
MVCNQLSKRLVLLLALVSTVAAVRDAQACTAFMVADGDKVLVGNNEDFNRPHTRMWFIPAEKGQYGRVYFGYENWSPQGGMNDQGLFFDFFATKPLVVRDSTDRPRFPGPMTDHMAATCATVEDVLVMFGKYNLEFMANFQMFIVDKSGDAAILEGDQVVRKRGAYQIVTNFYHSRVKENSRPCEWYRPSCAQYKTVEAMLGQNSTASVQHFRDTLKATHRNTIYARTLYSNIYDLKKGLVYLYYLHDFDNQVVIDLQAELKKGRHYQKLPDLFGRKLAYKSKTYTHSQPDFSIPYPEHYKVVPPENDEVLRVKCPFSSTPLFGVYVEQRPDNVPLQDIGVKYLAQELETLGSSVRLVSTAPLTLADGTPANEAQFDWVVNQHWPVKTLIVSAYREDKLVVAAVTAFAHPEIFREFLHSLTFR